MHEVNAVRLCACTSHSPASGLMLPPGVQAQGSFLELGEHCTCWDGPSRSWQGLPRLLLSARSARKREVRTSGGVLGVHTRGCVSGLGFEFGFHHRCNASQLIYKLAYVRLHHSGGKEREEAVIPPHPLPCYATWKPCIPAAQGS